MDSHVEIEPRVEGFLVKDEGAGLEVHAGHAELKENSKPLNAFTFGANGKIG